MVDMRAIIEYRSQSHKGRFMEYMNSLHLFPFRFISQHSPVVIFPSLYAARRPFYPTRAACSGKGAQSVLCSNTKGVTGQTGLRRGGGRFPIPTMGNK